MLTEAKCRGSKPATKSDSSPKTAMLHDGGGLYLQVSPGAGDTVNRSWLYRYTIAGKGRQVGLGAWPTISLADARKAADVQRGLRAAGKDPLMAKRAARAELEAQLAAEQPERAPRRQTFAQCTETYIAAHAAEWRNSKSEAAWRGTLKTFAFPVIGSMDVADITDEDVLKILGPIWVSKNVTARALMNRVAKVISFAMVKGYRPRGQNPAAWRDGLEHSLAKPDKVSKVEHHAALHHSDVAAFMSELAESTAAAAPALRFTILTAARTSETRKARWSEFDPVTRVWTVPGDRMKGGRDHDVPLSDAAFAILMAVRGEGDPEPGDYVFARPHGLPFSEDAMLKLAKKLRPGVEITTHGFRSSFRDWAGDETEIAREVAEAALAHKVGDAAEQAYRRGTALAKRRTLMEAWASHCVGGTHPFQQC
jgi:integrase